MTAQHPSSCIFSDAVMIIAGGKKAISGEGKEEIGSRDGWENTQGGKGR